VEKTTSREDSQRVLLPRCADQIKEDEIGRACSTQWRWHMRTKFWLENMKGKGTRKTHAYIGG